MRRTFTLTVVYYEPGVQTEAELRECFINKIEYGSLTDSNVSYSLAPLTTDAVELERCKLCGHTSFDRHDNCDYCDAPKGKSYSVVVDEETRKVLAAPSCRLCDDTGWCTVPDCNHFCFCELGNKKALEAENE